MWHFFFHDNKLFDNEDYKGLNSIVEKLNGKMINLYNIYCYYIEFETEQDVKDFIEYIDSQILINKIG